MYGTKLLKLKPPAPPEGAAGVGRGAAVVGRGPAAPGPPVVVAPGRVDPGPLGRPDEAAVAGRGPVAVGGRPAAAEPPLVAAGLVAVLGGVDGRRAAPLLGAERVGVAAAVSGNSSRKPMLVPRPRLRAAGAATDESDYRCASGCRLCGTVRSHQAAVPRFSVLAFLLTVGTVAA